MCVSFFSKCIRGLKIICAAMFLFLLPLSLFCQISSDEADFIDSTKYPNVLKQDPIFIFNKDENNPSDSTGSLTVTKNDTNSYKFSWYKYNPLLKLFDTSSFAVATDTNAMYVEGLVTGGYMLISESDSISDTSVVWVYNCFFDSNARITNKRDKNDTLTDGFNCSYFELDAYAKPDTFFYYNYHKKHDLMILDTWVEFVWGTDNPDSGVPGKKRRVNGVFKGFVTPFPTKNTMYTVTMTNNSGAVRYDTVYFRTIYTKASIDFDVMYYGEQNPNYYSDPETPSAPLDVKVDASRSKNANVYYWTYGDGNSNTTTDTNEIFLTYYIPGTYEIKLQTTSKELCTNDTTVIIKVGPAKLNFPNFFVPDGSDEIKPGSNNIFRLYDVSISDFEITIVNRWGQRVHYYKGDIREWDGWNGRMEITNALAPEGVYFYVVKARGYYDPIKKEISSDNNNFKARRKDFFVYKGFVHLFRIN